MEANEEPNRECVQQQKNKTSFVTSWNKNKLHHSTRRPMMKPLKRILPIQQPKSNARLQIITEGSVQATEYKCNKRKIGTCVNCQPGAWQCCCCISFPLTEFKQIYTSSTTKPNHKGSNPLSYHSPKHNHLSPGDLIKTAKHEM